MAAGGNKRHFKVFGRFRKNCEKRQLASWCLSISPSAWSNSTPNGRIFV